MPLDTSNFRGGYNFLGLPEADARYDSARAVILPVPYDSTTSYRSGTRDGPLAILLASRNVELFDIELDCEPLSTGIHTLPELEPEMSGPQHTVQAVERAVSGLLADHKFPVLLGGEHSLSIGAIEACQRHYGADLSVLQLDAHADLRKAYEGTPYNHACAMAKIWELVNLTQVGIRNISQREVEFIRQVGHQGIFWAHDLEGTDESWMDRVLERLTGEVYITIDLDAFDPSIMPAVGTPEPGGLLWYPTLRLLRKVIEQKKVIGFDVMELCPIPGQISSDFMAAKLVFKLLGMVFHKNGWIVG